MEKKLWNYSMWGLSDCHSLNAVLKLHISSPWEICLALPFLKLLIILLKLLIYMLSTNTGAFECFSLNHSFSCDCYLQSPRCIPPSLVIFQVIPKVGLRQSCKIIVELIYLFCELKINECLDYSSVYPKFLHQF